METPKQNQPARAAGNSTERLALKSVVVAVLILLLWTATLLIQSIIDERQMRQRDAIREVGSKWGQRQTLSGPVITVPYYEPEKNTDDYKKQQGNAYRKVIKYAHFLPEKLNINGKLFPEKRYRGIYEVMVYNSELFVKGNFSYPDFDVLNIPKENILYDDAFVSVGISDLRGIEEEISLDWNNEKIFMSAGIPAKDVLESGINCPIKIARGDSLKITFEFSFSIKLKGSEVLYFTPIGKETNVSLASNWPSPSFDGNFLPDQRNISDTGFTANWNVLHLNRNYPQQWLGSSHEISYSAFGVNLFTPVDNYQKSTRSVKYAIMIIALTFLVMFFVEILNNKAIHPFQYILIGLALCIFYSLLISISEQSNFNFAYLISGLATVGLIAAYSKSVLKENKLVALVSSVLVILNGYIFSLIQLEDYAFLMGSIGLFVALSLVMYYSRKIDWYNLNKPKN